MNPPSYPLRPINGGPLPRARPKSGTWLYEPKINGWRAIVNTRTGAMWNRHGKRLSIELWDDEDEASDKFITVTDRDPDNHQYYYFNTLGERIVHCNARFYELTPIGFATATKIIKKYSLAKKPKFSITILDDSNKTTNTTQLINTTNA